MKIQKSKIAILVLNQCPISAVFQIVRFAGDQKTALTGDSLYIYAVKVGADVIDEWSLTLNGQGMLNKIIAHFSFCLNKGDLYKTAELCIHFACQGELSVF